MGNYKSLKYYGKVALALLCLFVAMAAFRRLPPSAEGMVLPCRGGPREGSGRPKKRKRVGSRKKSGRPPALAELTQSKARAIIGDDGLSLVKARAGQLVTRDRCMEVLRATRTAIVELYDDADRSLWKKSHAIVKLVRERCSCGHGIANRALQALKDCTTGAIEEFVLNEITKRPQGKGGVHQCKYSQ